MKYYLFRENPSPQMKFLRHANIWRMRSRYLARAPLIQVQNRYCLIEPGMYGFRAREHRTTQLMYTVGMSGLLLVAYFNSYGESRGVWPEDDPMYREVLRVLHHPKFLKEVGFPLETGLASTIQTPRSYTHDVAPFRYLMVYGTRMRGQVKVEFEDMFRGWIAMHVNLDNGKRFSFYNPQKFKEPGPDAPAFTYNENAELKQVIVEKGQHVPMPDKIPKEAWRRWYDLCKYMGVFVIVVFSYGYFEAWRHGKGRLKKHLNRQLTNNLDLESVMGFPVHVNYKDFQQFKLDGTKFFLASRLHGSLGTGQLCCYGTHDGEKWNFQDAFVQVDEDMHSATRVDVHIEPLKIPPPGRLQSFRRMEHSEDN